MEPEEYPENDDQLRNMYKPRFKISEINALFLKVIFWFIPNFALNVFWINEDGFALQTYYLTFIGINIVTISTFLSILISIGNISKIKLGHKLLRGSHMVFELTFSMQILITFVYWTVLHSKINDFTAGKVITEILFAILILKFTFWTFLSEVGECC